ncbi:MAG: YlxR family protein, partial [Acidobacteria bacterium]|nr:YlxR family protein [Acidobacteriota bacterium]
PGGSAAGRGAYVHPDPECVALATRRGALAPLRDCGSGWPLRKVSLRRMASAEAVCRLLKPLHGRPGFTTYWSRL